MKIRVAMLGMATLVCAACAKGPAKSSPNVQTSLGTLAAAERRIASDPANPEVALKAGEVSYFLTFKGKITIADYEKGWETRVPLLDSEHREFVPVLAGTPTANGKLSQDKWTMNGNLTASGGRWIFKGSASVPDGTLVLAYVIPANAKGLALKDGAASHPLGLD
jgi:hypothetical protein